MLDSGERTQDLYTTLLIAGPVPCVIVHVTDSIGRWVAVDSVGFQRLQSRLTKPADHLPVVGVELQVQPSSGVVLLRGKSSWRSHLSHTLSKDPIPRGLVARHSPFFCLMCSVKTAI